MVLEWKTNFAISNAWYMQLWFQPTGSTGFGSFPIATLANSIPSKNPRNTNFNNKISAVQTTKQQSSSFNFKVSISNMAITEEGIYELRRGDALGQFTLIKTVINAGVIGKWYITKNYCRKV